MESSKLDNDSCSTEFLAGLKLENDSCSTEFLASIEDLLDFSDSEIANPVFSDVCKSEFPAGAQVKAEPPGFISGDVCKSEFPAGVQVKTEPPEFISAGSGVHDSGELFVPSDDLEEMDWFSCLLEDPIPTIPARIPPKQPTSDSSTPAFTVKPPKQTTSEEFRTTSPTSVLETTFPLQVPKSETASPKLETAFPSPETTFPLQVPKLEIASPRPETAFPSPETTFLLQVPKSETAFPRSETALPRPVTTIPARRRTKRPRPTFTKICWFLPSIISRETSPENNSDDFSSGYGPHMLQKKNKKRKSPHEKENTYEINRRCMHCSIQKTPQWRTGPMGPKTLCNACGVRYKSGRLLPEYRPAASPTFTPLKHSNSHRKVMEMRIKKWNKEKHECLEERLLLDPILHD